MMHESVTTAGEPRPAAALTTMATRAGASRRSLFPSNLQAGESVWASFSDAPHPQQMRSLAWCACVELRVRRVRQHNWELDGHQMADHGQRRAPQQRDLETSVGGQLAKGSRASQTGPTWSGTGAVAPPTIMISHQNIFEDKCSAVR